jgi:hypothetical protein
VRASSRTLERMLPRYRRNVQRGVAGPTPTPKRFTVPSARTVLGHALWFVAFMGGLILSMYLATAFMRSVLHGPDAAASFLRNPDVTIGDGEAIWGILLGAIGGIIATVYCQKLLVRFGVLSQRQVDDTWKE